ncbi:MAG: arylsulfatase A-like enzyme [Planctomycetota bacterium]|jgi:arylsulfatase A-like enzyme
MSRAAMPGGSSPTVVHQLRRDTPAARFPRVPARSAAYTFRMRLLRGPLLALSLAVLSACSGGSTDDSDDSGDSDLADAQRSTRLILISLDTLRADHLALYGYERPTSPQLERFATQATRYTRAQAAAPWTLPSHASIFTGLHPYEHGARTWPMEQLSALAGKGWKANNNVGPLAPERVTLAEVLRGEGYATGAVVANLAFLDPNFGISQGFDHYDQERGPVEDLNRRALEWLDARDAEQPSFLFINYMDTHRPYNTRPREGFESASTYGNALARVAPLILTEGAQVPPELLQACIDQYDLAIANLDAGLGEFFDALRERGLFEDALIIITSDHGEFLGEKALIEHSKDVYQGALHVPLLVKAPGQKLAAVDEDWIGHIHLPELALNHLRLHNRAAAERALAHHPRAQVPLLSENYYTRTKDLNSPWAERFKRVRRVLVQDDWKYIDSSDGNHELYDLGRDPGEEVSQITAEPKRAERMSQALEAILNAMQAAPLPGAPVPMSEELIQSMIDMGYAGGDEDDDDED